VTTLPPLGSERLLPSIVVAACHVASAGGNGDVTASGSTEAIEACHQMVSRTAGRGGVARGDPFRGPWHGAGPESASMTGDDWRMGWGTFP
jgi:hypothetical protein